MATPNSDGSIVLSTKVDTSGAKSGFSSLKSGIESTAKAFAVVGTAAAAAVSAVVTASVKSYAEYEQLVGGVETLFGDSSEKLMQYANVAYETAGLSANEYMATVTSFSASLLQSLGGDTEAATEYANQAIIDMSDNANKMGTSMEMIQNAYQGFAKQNFTMLDNLKLGYGGTKEEMQRLLQDAEKISGIRYDISSFADVTQAINVIQTQLGITGTTALEASTTIQGSFNSMKSSWQNLLVAISSDDLPFDDYVNNFVDSVSKVAENLIPRIQIALGGVVQLVDQLAPVIIEKIPDLFNSLLPSIISASTDLIKSVVGIFPSLIDTALDVLPLLMDGVFAIINELINALPSIIESLVSALPKLIPMLIDGIVSMIVTICNNILPIIQPIIDALPEIIKSIGNSFLTNAPVLIDVFIKTFTEVSNALVDEIPSIITFVVNSIIENLPAILNSITAFLSQSIPVLLEASIQFMNSIVDSIDVIIPAIIEAIPVVLNSIIAFFTENYPILIEAAVKLFSAIIEALLSIGENLSDAIPQLLQAVTDGLSGFPEMMETMASSAFDAIKNVFSEKKIKEYFNSVLNNIKNVFGGISDWFENTFSNAWQSVKDVFSSGGSVFNGIKEGIDKTFKTVVNKLIDGINSIISTPFNKINDMLASLKNISILGAKPFSFINTFAVPQIPKLAKGAVIPPNKEFLALLGDQRQGVNIETPLETMVQAFQMALDSRRYGNQSSEIVLEIDGRELGRAVLEQGNMESRRLGVGLVISR